MDATKSLEQVLVIPDERFRAAGVFQGFRPYDAGFFNAILDRRYLSFRPRGEVETDPTLKQLIPYTVLRCRGELFHYTRGRSGAEKRLQALRSVGVGGHISREDGPPDDDPYHHGKRRELDEEMEISSPYAERCLGFIYDGTTPVGQVHLGVVHLLELEEALAWPRESGIEDAGFAPLRDLLRNRDEFESWSQFVMERLRDEAPP